jgi:translin
MMEQIEAIADRIRQELDVHTANRDQALTQARALTRFCANAIRALHRRDTEKAEQDLAEARTLAEGLRTDLLDYPYLYYAGYTQDALKEYAEATIVAALLVDGGALPTPEELGIPSNTYLKGLAEAIGELRRGSLDLLRTGQADEAEQFLQKMDDIYSILVTMDYPDAVTHGLRRLTDISRSIIERTRGDITLSLRQERLENTLRNFEQGLSDE